jgi:hypothetical protein
MFLGLRMFGVTMNVCFTIGVLVKKMKKRILTIATLVCCALTMVFLTSCKQKESTKMYRYVAHGSIQTAESSIDPMPEGIYPTVGNYTDAINEAMGVEVLDAADDAAIIKACDEVYNYQVEHFSGHISLDVKILRFEAIDGIWDEGTVIKEYKYPVSK